MFLFQYDATYVKINYPPGPKEQQKKDDNERVDYIIKQSKNGPRNGFQYTGPAMLGISNGDGTRKWVEIGKDQTVWLVNEAGPISGTPTYYVFKPGVKDIHIYDVSSDPVDKMDEIKGKYNRYSVGGDEGDAIVLSKEDYNKYYANKETEEENKEGETKTKKEKLPAPGQIGLPDFVKYSFWFAQTLADTTRTKDAAYNARKFVELLEKNGGKKDIIDWLNTVAGELEQGKTATQDEVDNAYEISAQVCKKEGRKYAEWLYWDLQQYQKNGAEGSNALWNAEYLSEIFKAINANLGAGVPAEFTDFLASVSKKVQNGEDITSSDILAMGEIVKFTGGKAGSKITKMKEKTPGTKKQKKEGFTQKIVYTDPHTAYQNIEKDITETPIKSADGNWSVKLVDGKVKLFEGETEYAGDDVEARIVQTVVQCVKHGVDGRWGNETETLYQGYISGKTTTTTPIDQTQQTEQTQENKPTTSIGKFDEFIGTHPDAWARIDKLEGEQYYKFLYYYGEDNSVDGLVPNNANIDALLARINACTSEEEKVTVFSKAMDDMLVDKGWNGKTSPGWQKESWQEYYDFKMGRYDRMAKLEDPKVTPEYVKYMEACEKSGDKAGAYYYYRLRGWVNDNSRELYDEKGSFKAKYFREQAGWFTGFYTEESEFKNDARYKLLLEVYGGDEKKALSDAAVTGGYSIRALVDKARETQVADGKRGSYKDIGEALKNNKTLFNEVFDFTTMDPLNQGVVTQETWAKNIGDPLRALKDFRFSDEKLVGKKNKAGKPEGGILDKVRLGIDGKGFVIYETKDEKRKVETDKIEAERKKKDEENQKKQDEKDKTKTADKEKETDKTKTENTVAVNETDVFAKTPPSYLDGEKMADWFVQFGKSKEMTGVYKDLVKAYTKESVDAIINSGQFANMVNVHNAQNADPWTAKGDRKKLAAEVKAMITDPNGFGSSLVKVGDEKKTETKTTPDKEKEKGNETTALTGAASYFSAIDQAKYGWFIKLLSDAKVQSAVDALGKNKDYIMGAYAEIAESLLIDGTYKEGAIKADDIVKDIKDQAKDYNTQ